MKDQIELPPLPMALNSTLAAPHARKYARAAIEADRQRIESILEARYDRASTKYALTRDHYDGGFMTALDIAMQIVAGEIKE